MPKKILNFEQRKKFEFKNVSATRAEISIYGDIGESFWGDSITANDVHEALKAMDKTVKNVDVRINSGGGCVFTGVAIYNLLKSSGKKITTYVDGIAASIASIIALAGDEVLIGDGAMIMIHRPLCGVMGNASALMNMIERLDDVEEQLISIYTKNTNMDRTAIKAYLVGENGNDGTYFDSAESIELGLATGLMNEDVALDMAATLGNSTWIRDRKEIIKRYDNHVDVIDNVLKDIEDFKARDKA